MEKKNNPAVLPIQIAYYTGLRIGEACGLDWQDINLEEQCLTVRRSMRYNQMRHKEVDFGNVLTDILKKAKKEQLQAICSLMEQHRKKFRSFLDTPMSVPR